MTNHEVNPMPKRSVGDTPHSGMSYREWLIGQIAASGASAVDDEFHNASMWSEYVTVLADAIIAHLDAE